MDLQGGDDAERVHQLGWTNTRDFESPCQVVQQ